MKKLIILANVLLMTGCLHAPPEAYEIYHRHHINDKQTKEDMKACGFPDVCNTDYYFVHYENDYVMTSAVNNGEKHLVDFIRQPDGKSLGILGQVT